MPWVTAEYAARLAELHPRSILRGCRDGKYHSRRVAGRYGKGRLEVDIATLPAVAQQRWALNSNLVRMPSPQPEPPARDAEPSSAGLSEERLAWAQYRYGIIEPLATGAWAASGHASRVQFIAAMTRREFTKPNGKTEQISASGIYRMLRRFTDGGLAALANDERSDRGASKMPVPMQDFVLAAYCSGGSSAHPSLRSVREVARLVDEERRKRRALARAGKLRAYIHREDEFVGMPGEFRVFLDGDRPMPEDYYLFPPASYGTIRRFCAAIPQPFKVLARLGLKAYQDGCEKTTTRDYASIRPMEYVVFDHRRCDIFVMLKRRGKWTLIRPWETVAMDMKTRMVLGVVQCETPSALSVASCIRQVILRGGLFEHAYLDNGKEFTAQYIDGDGSHERAEAMPDFGAEAFAPTRGILSHLGVKVIHALPYGARSKSIEPSFRNPARYERTLAGSCGNRAANRPEWLAGWEHDFKRFVAGAEDASNHPFHQWDDFRELKNWFYFEEYNRREHSGRGMNGRSPEQAMRVDHVEAGLARRVDPRELDLLLQKRKVRKVANGGTFVVAWGGNDYVYSHAALFLRQGEPLETSYDPYDVSEINVYEPGGGYVCTARCEPLRGMGEREFSDDIKARRRLLKQTKEAVEQLHRFASVPSAAERVAWSRVLAAAAGADSRPLTIEAEPVQVATAATPVELARELPPASEPEPEPEEDRLQFLGS